MSLHTTSTTFLGYNISHQRVMDLSKIKAVTKLFMRFQFKVMYQPSSKNSRADALSRGYDPSNCLIRQYSSLPPSNNVAPIRWDIMEEIQHQQKKKLSKPTRMTSNQTISTTNPQLTHHPMGSYVIQLDTLLEYLNHSLFLRGSGISLCIVLLIS